MLYVIHIIIYILLVSYLILKHKYSLHGILAVYFLAIMVVDIPEIIFSTLFSFYRFHPGFVSGEMKETELALLFCDGLILPFTAILFIHFAARFQRPWIVSFIAVGAHFIMECIYLSLGLLEYVKWNIWISMVIYLVGFRIAATYARRLLYYNPPIPYFIRIASITYSINAWIGGVFGGAFIGLWQWRPYLFEKAGGDERFCDLTIGWSLAFLAAILLPRITSRKIRAGTFMLFALCASGFYIYANFRGWLHYVHWNHFWSVMRWFAPFIVIILYDRWENAVSRTGLAK